MRNALNFAKIKEYRKTRKTHLFEALQKLNTNSARLSGEGCSPPARWGLLDCQTRVVRFAIVSQRYMVAQSGRSQGFPRSKTRPRTGGAGAGGGGGAAAAPPLCRFLVMIISMYHVLTFKFLVKQLFRMLSCGLFRRRTGCNWGAPIGRPSCQRQKAECRGPMDY